MNFIRWLTGLGGTIENTNTGLKVIKTPALGRPFRLGMLYDQVQETIIPGESLLTLKDIETHTFSTKKQGCSFDVICGDSLQEQSAVYKGDANLELNFLKGAASFGCSGKFLKNSISNKNHLRVSLTAEYITLYEELVMEQFKSCISNMNTNATHIVTAIEYGAHVSFTFDRTVSEDENELKVSGELKGMIDKIPSLNVSGDATGSIGKIDIKKAEKISCTFCGDVMFDENPTTYKDAVTCYKELSARCKDKAMPVNVWLYPISKQSTPANQVLQAINEEKMQQAVTVLEDLQRVYSACNELMSEPAIPLIPGVKFKIDRFREVLQKKMEDFKHQVLGELLKELDLPSLTISRWQFEVKYLQAWISQNIETEINILNIYINKLKEGNVEILAESDVNAKLFDNDEVIILDIYQDFSDFRNMDGLKNDDWSRLAQMDEYHKTINIRFNMKMDHRKYWFERDDTLEMLRENVKTIVCLKSTPRKNCKLFVTFTECYERDNPDNRISLFKIYMKGKCIKQEHMLQTDKDAIDRLFA